MCLEKIIKFIVFIFNFLFVVVGIALIVVGVLYKINFTEITDAIPDDYVNLHLAPILTIVVGSIVVAISFLGCWGACVDSSCLLTTYAIVLLTIFILQVGLGVFAFLEVNDEKDMKSKIDNKLANVFSKYEQNKTRELVDLIQQDLKCCGTKGPDSWSPSKVPPSCCEEKNCTMHTPFKDGCQAKFYDFLKDSSKIIGIVVLSLSAVEVVGAIVSLCLANSIRNEARRNPYA